MWHTLHGSFEAGQGRVQDHVIAAHVWLREVVQSSGHRAVQHHLHTRWRREGKGREGEITTVK